MNLRPNIIIGVTAVIVLFIMLSLAQEMNRRWQVQKEVARLEGEVRELANSVVELDNLNQYFRTDDFQERLAREKLNYRAPGEEVVLIPEQELNPVNEETPDLERGDLPSSLPLRWWNQFFGVGRG